MNDTLYLQLDQNIEVHHPHVYLQDIARLSCTNAKLVKTAFVCLISFFGAAFSIMTFNTDADVGKLFRQIYEQVTGSVSNGFTILEFTYSVGLGLGVLFFFNHFSRVKITSDPSPMQVQMRIYEDQVNSTVIEDINRKQAAEHQEPS